MNENAHSSDINPQPEGQILTPPTAQVTPVPAPKTGIGKLIENKIEKLEDKKNQLSIKIHWYDRAWAWMNGKKRVAGVVLMIGGGVLCLIPGAQAEGLTMIGKGIFSAGSLLAVTGFLHKILKSSSIGAKGEFGNKELIELVIKILTLIIELIQKMKKKEVKS